MVEIKPRRIARTNFAVVGVCAVLGIAASNALVGVAGQLSWGMHRSEWIMVAGVLATASGSLRVLLHKRAWRVFIPTRRIYERQLISWPGVAVMACGLAVAGAIVYWPIAFAS